MSQVVMNYNCLFGNNDYQQLNNSDSSLEMQQSAADPSIQQVELNFYNEDDTYHTVVVEENLRVGDLCQLLATKNRVSKDTNWAIVERNEDLGLERSLEDHEEVQNVYSRWQHCNKPCANRFYFRKDFTKYEFFRNPQQFFPEEMTDFKAEECFSGSADLARMITLQTIINSKNEVPRIFSHLWFREEQTHVWKKAFFLLTDRTLHYSLQSSEKETSQLMKYASLDNYLIYSVVHIKKNYKVPTEHCFCLKQAEEAIFNDDSKEAIFLACESERMRICWVTSLRFAKYGKQLRDNYQILARQTESARSPKKQDHNYHELPSVSTRTRVAMDFTGDCGKIVENPKEVEAIALAEAVAWHKKLRSPSSRHLSASSLRGVDMMGVHVAQPWFHGNLPREEAAHLLTKHGAVDGVFLIRESCRTRGTFVLSFLYAEKAHHMQIFPLEERDQILYSLDNGKTKFYDILQLVEFYQLNAGCLPTTLTHYVSQRKDCSK